jgi:PTH1 family peptidyl-tRNA hydrolase
MHYIVGLGNPGEKYEMTRHNAGRIVLATFLKAHDMPTPVISAKYSSLISEGDDIFLMFPETFMNKSGSAVAKIVTSAKKAKNLIVVYDDMDLPLGSIKISFGRSSGGHNGVESIIKTLKTKDFVRIRVGICPATPTGKLRKPKGEQKILDFLMGDFKTAELDILKKVSKKVAEAIDTIMDEGHVQAMNQFN